MCEIHRDGRCPDCAGGVFSANGKCGQCDGTGINIKLNSDEPKCPSCGGTGVCATCGGTGTRDWGEEGPTIQTLFG